MMLFSAAVTSTSLPGLLRSRTVAVDMLAASQHLISDGFSRRGTDKFVGVAHQPGPHGVPLLTALSRTSSARSPRRTPGATTASCWSMSRA